MNIKLIANQSYNMPIIVNLDVAMAKKKGHGVYHDPFAEAINLCNYFTASLSALPGLKAGTLLAPISISSPV